MEGFNGCDFAEEVMGRTCTSPSNNFKGACIIHHNCKLICIDEGFEDGICKGLRRRCLCRKTCE